MQIEEKPTIGDIFYGDTMSDELLNGGKVRTSSGELVEGEFCFGSQDIQISFVGKGYLDIMFIPMDTENYEIISTKIEVDVSKAILTIIPNENLGHVYGEEEQNITFTVNGYKLNDDVSVLSGSLEREDGKNAGSYRILKGSLYAGEYYDISITEEYYTIHKANPILQVGDFTSFVYEGTNTQELYFNNYTADVNGTFLFEEKVLEIGDNTVQYNFTPMDSLNYNSVVGQLIINAEPRKIMRLEIVEVPTKVAYNKGEEFEIDGLVVKAIYTNYTESIIQHSDLSLSGYDKDKVGEQTVTISYRGKQTSFDVMVHESSDISNTPQQGCSSYIAGTSFLCLGLLIFGFCILTIKKCKKN